MLALLPTPPTRLSASLEGFSCEFLCDYSRCHAVACFPGPLHVLTTLSPRSRHVLAAFSPRSPLVLATFSASSHRSVGATGRLCRWAFVIVFANGCAIQSRVIDLVRGTGVWGLPRDTERIASCQTPAMVAQETVTGLQPSQAQEGYRRTPTASRLLCALQKSRLQPDPVTEHLACRATLPGKARLSFGVSGLPCHTRP